jgi:hypothetical protein
VTELFPVLPVQQDPPSRYLGRAGQGTQKRGFPAAIAAKQAYQLPFLNRKGDILDNR